MSHYTPYLLVLLAGYGFGNRPASYLAALAIAAFAGVVQLPEEMPSLGEMASLEQKASLAARRHGLEPGLFRALIAQESAWNPSAVSAKGATGLTQLMPATAREHCGLSPSDLPDPEKNLDCGARYLAAQLARFSSVELALAAYNAGPERVARLGRVPRIPETQHYVRQILAMSESEFSELKNYQN